MNHIERITHMEQILDRSAESISQLSDAFYNYLQLVPELKELADYYCSQEWLDDYDADNAGRLPKDLKRGVLSQDAVFNLLEENNLLLESLYKLSGKLMEEENVLTEVNP